VSVSFMAGRDKALRRTNPVRNAGKAPASCAAKQRYSASRLALPASLAQVVKEHSLP